MSQGGQGPRPCRLAPETEEDRVRVELLGGRSLAQKTPRLRVPQPGGSLELLAGELAQPQPLFEQALAGCRIPLGRLTLKLPELLVHGIIIDAGRAPALPYPRATRTGGPNP